MTDTLNQLPSEFASSAGRHMVDKVAGALSDMYKSTGRDVMTLHGSRFYLGLGGLSGAVALSMAAYGTYAFKVRDENGEQLKKIYKTGYKMHLVQSVALVCSPLCNRPNLTGGLLTTGILLFSGSCYVHAMTGNTKVRYITPYGGVTLILAWLSMLL